MQSQSSSKRAASSSLGSEFDKKPRLGLTDEEAERLNKNLSVMMHHPKWKKENVPTGVLALALHLVTFSMQTMGRATISQSLPDVEQRINILSHEEQLELASIWVEARNKGDWRGFADHSLLQTETPTVETSREIEKAYPHHLDDQIAVTEKSWELPFKGNAARGVWEHIKIHYKPSNTNVYAHYAAIVQSSGMGKSRTVDELSKEHFVIPLNLRDERSTGYPPADDIVRSYLTAACSKNDAYDRASAFLEALFEQATSELSALDSSASYAKEFRLRMTEGQKMAGHNQFRREFYKNIIHKAGRLEAQRRGSKWTASVDPRSSTPAQSMDYPPYIALQQLIQGIQSQSSGATVKGKQKAKACQADNGNPLVILMFDEAHTITQRHRANGDEWSIFNELRHALRRLHSLPLFSLFLSTTGKISQYTSPIEEDLSKRVAEGKLVVIRPYADFGFDLLAHMIVADGSLNLEQLTDDSQICSLGRPLFATRYLEGSNSVKREIILFAAAKLLNADYSTQELSNDQVLACLSQRFPIEFNSTNYISQEKERKQVEGHMRICVKIDADFETMTTTSSSEPILSEAAYFMMQKPFFNAPKGMQSVMEGFSISKGDRGEFLVLLLLILARDTTVGAADEFGRPITGRRWFGLTDFLYQTFQKQASPSELMDKDSITALNNLPTDFPNAQLHFNHFVKVHEHKAIDILSLLLLQGRGAAVLCANGQAGIDAINVFLRDGTALAMDNVGLILYQVKNDSSYKTIPEQALFESMDPYNRNILGKGAPAVPLIKIVFALAVNTPTLHVVRHDPTTKYPAPIYDIWCTGISPHILGPIKQHQAGIWNSLLQASYGWKELYKNIPRATTDLRRSVFPGAAREVGHYSSWAQRSTL